MGVGVDALGRARFDERGERQPFLLRQRLHALGDRLDRPGDAYRFRRELDFAGLDLGEIEDVVDQRQQIVSGRADRLGELHLFLGEVAFFVVCEQPGQDQRRVERRPQFVAHVGEEFALVAIRPFQVRRSLDEVVLGVGQILLLHLQDLCLFLELGIDLLELGLLRFQANLRFTEDSTLFFELLVTDAQLLLLRLQFFRLLLRLGEQLLEARTIL